MLSVQREKFPGSTHGRIPVLLTRFLLLALVAETLVSCKTPDQRYETLSFFFDGVPDPNAVQEEEVLVVSTEVEELPFSLHPPYAQRKCDLCHDSSFSNALRLEKSKLCASCHSSDQMPGKFLHGPAGSGQCYACHHPHRSKLPNLLLGEGNDLCGQCHKPETFVGLEKHRMEKGENCLGCHSPHGSDMPYLIREKKSI